jgi:hypothetical protein
MNKFGLITFSVILLFLSSCATKRSVAPVVDGIQIKKDISFLADDALEGRRTGTEGEVKAAIYIANRFKALGLAPKGTDGYFQEFSTRKKSNPHAQSTTDSDPLITGRNVIGGIDNGAAQTIVIGAHFDHLGHGGEGSLSPNSADIHNGADDNASGVSALLALAEMLKKGHKGNNYLFLAFSGEEEGLWGSNYFTKNPTVSIDNINYMINMDMVGRLNEERQLAIYGIGTSPVWKETIDAINTPSFKFTFTESGVGPSDHTSFYLQDIPVLHFFTGQHKDYHKPSDDVEWINFDGIKDISSFIYTLVGRLDNKGEIAFTKTKDEQPGRASFKVTLGVVPDYLYDGEGMRIDGVSEGKPAKNAGMQAGDIVIKMGEHQVADMMGYMKALGMFEKGQSTIVIIKREGKMIEKEVVF